MSDRVFCVMAFGLVAGYLAFGISVVRFFIETGSL